MSGRLLRWFHALAVRAWAAHARAWADLPPRLTEWS